jgi:transposase-like protein
MTTDRVRRHRAKLVRQWETSGESRRAFARRHGLTLSQFDYWKRQVRRDAAAAAPSFAPVQLVMSSETSGSNAIDVTLAGGERLTIREGVSVDLVRTVIAALRPSC